MSSSNESLIILITILRIFNLHHKAIHAKSYLKLVLIEIKNLDPILWLLTKEILTQNLNLLILVCRWQPPPTFLVQILLIRFDGIGLAC